MKKNVLIVLALIVVLALALVVFLMRTPDQPVTPAQSTSTDQVVVDPHEGWNTFATGTFRVRYPSILLTNSEQPVAGLGLTEYASKLPGITLYVPRSFTEGTNLSEDSSITIKEDASASKCSYKDLIEGEPASTSTERIGRDDWDVSVFHDAGAGNFYEHYLYVSTHSDVCRIASILIHSTNIGNYDPGTVKEYDKEEVVTLFASVLTTLKDVPIPTTNDKLQQ